LVGSGTLFHALTRLGGGPRRNADSAVTADIANKDSGVCRAAKAIRPTRGSDAGDAGDDGDDGDVGIAPNVGIILWEWAS
jgi:hypothetical protein